MRNLILYFLLEICLRNLATGQVLCVQCFDQNDEISAGVNNLILNGGFENTNCIPGWINDSYCPNSSLYDCDIDHWLCTGGGGQSYPGIFDSTLCLIPEGHNAAYFGNGNAFTCSEQWGDFTCETFATCSLTGFLSGFPKSLPGYGDQTGVSIEQTISGLSIGHTYVLEFWAGGEPLQGLLTEKGIFAVDVGFGKTYLTCKPTDYGNFPTGTVYLIEFIAASASHTIKFTNWGHVCDLCTELVIDNVRLYTIEELSNTVPGCATSSHEPEVKSLFDISPNPFNSSLCISGHMETEIEFNLYDSQATKVLHLIFNGSTTQNTEHLGNGIYFYELRNKSGVLKSGKLVKQ